MLSAEQVVAGALARYARGVTVTVAPVPGPERVAEPWDGSDGPRGIGAVAGEATGAGWRVLATVARGQGFGPRVVDSIALRMKRDVQRLAIVWVRTAGGHPAGGREPWRFSAAIAYGPIVASIGFREAREMIRSGTNASGDVADVVDREEDGMVEVVTEVPEGVSVRSNAEPASTLGRRGSIDWASMLDGQWRKLTVEAGDFPAGKGKARASAARVFARRAVNGRRAVEWALSDNDATLYIRFGEPGSLPEAPEAVETTPAA